MRLVFALLNRVTPAGAVLSRPSAMPEASDAGSYGLLNSQSLAPVAMSMAKTYRPLPPGSFVPTKAANTGALSRRSIAAWIDWLAPRWTELNLPEVDRPASLSGGRL